MQALDALKTRLLDLAIRGHLVPQLDTEPEVEQPGDKTKESLFDIPKKWKWTLLSSLTDDISDGSHNPPKNVGSGVPVLSAKNIIGNDIDFSSTNRWATEDQWILEDKKIHIAPGDVLLTIVGTIGRTAVVKTNKKFMLQRSVCILKPKQRLLDSTFLSFALGSPHILQWMNDRAAGTAQKGVYLKTIKNMPFPLPPLEEQKRMVEKLDSLFSKIGVIQKSMDEVSQLGASLEKQLLQSAVKGQLVPQLDGEPEVEQLGDAPDEVLFEIPKKWKWGKLSDYGNIVGGGTPSTSAGEYWDGEIPWVTPADLGKIQSAWIDRGAKSITKLGLEKSSAKKMPAGSIVYSSRAPIGRVAIAKNELCTSQGCKSFVPDPTLVDSKYAYFALTALTPEIVARASGTTFKEISGKQFGKTLIPVPPLGEQRRIVEKLDKLMLEIQKLK